MWGIQRNRLRKQLSARRGQLERALETALLEEQEPLAVSRLADALKAARTAEQRFTRPRLHAIMLVLFLAFFVVSLIGIGIFVKLPIATIHLDVLATAVSVEAAERGSLGSGMSPSLRNIDSFPVKSLLIELASGGSDFEVIEHDRAEIAGFEVHGNARIRLWYEKPGCMSTKVFEPRATGEATGIAIFLVFPFGGSSVYPPPEKHFLGEGSVMTFCAPKDVRPFLLGPASALSLTHEYEHDNLARTTSSIVSGTVEIAGTSEARSLTPNDRVILDELDRAWLVLYRDSEAFRVSISGKVVAAQIKGNSPVNYSSEALIPNLLVFLTQSPTALLISLAVGLFGVFWNGVKILRGRMD